MWLSHASGCQYPSMLVNAQRIPSSVNPALTCSLAVRYRGSSKFTNADRADPAYTIRAVVNRATQDRPMPTTRTPALATGPVDPCRMSGDLSDRLQWDAVVMTLSLSFAAGSRNSPCVPALSNY